MAKAGERPNGWHLVRWRGMHEFWWDGKLIHQVTTEAWEDFQSYVRTPGGQRWAEAVIAEGTSA